MATEYTLRRADGQPFGSFEQVQALIRSYFSSVEFYWTTSGQEKIESARQHGIEMPPLLLEAIKDLPSLLEGVAQSEDHHVTFGLGHEEPVMCIIAQPRGSGPELFRGLEASRRLQVRSSRCQVQSDIPMIDAGEDPGMIRRDFLKRHQDVTGLTLDELHHGPRVVEPTRPVGTLRRS